MEWRQPHRRARPQRGRPGSRLPAPRPPDPRACSSSPSSTRASGDKILRAAGANTEKIKADLDAFLDENLETLPLGTKRPPDQTLAFRRVLQTAVLHVQSAGKAEADVGDILAALLAQGRSHAVDLLTGQGVSRLDILNYISHGVSKVPGESSRARDRRGRGRRRGTLHRAADPLSAYCVNLTERGRLGKLDPLIGRLPELQRALEILARRRKNNPVFVGDPGVGKTALVEGLALRLLQDDGAEILKGAEVFALDTGALLAGTRYRGDFEERFKAVLNALKKRPRSILFIDEMHTMVRGGATTGGTMDLANLIKPILTEGGDGVRNVRNPAPSSDAASIAISLRSSIRSEPLRLPASNALIVPCATCPLLWSRVFSGACRDPRCQLHVQTDISRPPATLCLQHGEDISRHVEVEGELGRSDDRDRQIRHGRGLEVLAVGVRSEVRLDGVGRAAHHQVRAALIDRGSEYHRSKGVQRSSQRAGRDERCVRQEDGERIGHLCGSLRLGLADGMCQGRLLFQDRMGRAAERDLEHHFVGRDHPGFPTRDRLGRGRLDVFQHRERERTSLEDGENRRQP